MSAGDNDALCAAAKKAFAAPFGAVLMLSAEDGAAVWIDGRDESPLVSTKAPAGVGAACTWRGARDALIRALSNTRAFESAYVSGRIHVAGDMSVMARLSLDDAR
jgi:hypothetical protein